MAILLAPYACHAQAGATPRGANLDPLAYVQQTCPGGDCPTYTQAIPDPQAGAWGDIKGLDAINNGTEFAIIYSGGNVSFYLDEPVITPTQSRPSIPLTIGANGISEVAGSYGGFGAQLAVSDISGIAFYDLDGNHKGRFGVSSPPLRDLTYDVERGRFVVATDLNVRSVNPDGTTVMLQPSGTFGVEYTNMTEDTGQTIDDMLQIGPIFARMIADGTVNGTLMTDLATGMSIQGMAVTQNHLLLAVDGGILVYDKMAFQDFMDYSMGRLLGDMNCDGQLDINDVAPFALALTNPAQYALDFPNCTTANGDMNQDSKVDGKDIQGFADTLTAP